MERKRLFERQGHKRLSYLLGTGLLVVAAFALGRATAMEEGAKPLIIPLSSVLSKNPPAKGEAFKVMPVAQGRDASVTVVRAAGELPPHYHESREEVVYVVRGGGTMLLGNEKRPVKAGDILHIPRRVPHGFVNGAKRETVVVSVMAPPFDGKDRIFLTPQDVTDR